MASPQIENGHTDIANEILEKLALIHLTGNEWKIICVIWRQTYGWHKKSDAISLSQFQQKTGLSRPSASEAIVKLVGKKVLLVNKDNTTNEYSFNKDYDIWCHTKEPVRARVVRKTLPSRDLGTKLVGKKVPKVVGKKVHTKENKESNKENIYIHEKTGGKFSTLESMTDAIIADVAREYSIDFTVAKAKWEDVVLYCQRNGRRYKNYKATLQTWIRGDIQSGKIKKTSQTFREFVPQADIGPAVSDDTRNKIRLELAKKLSMGNAWTEHSNDLIQYT